MSNKRYDIQGEEIEVGDIVVYSETKESYLYRAEVLGFSAKKIKLKGLEFSWTSTTSRNCLPSTIEKKYDNRNLVIVKKHQNER